VRLKYNLCRLSTLSICGYVYCPSSSEFEHCLYSSWKLSVNWKVHSLFFLRFGHLDDLVVDDKHFGLSFICANFIYRIDFNYIIFVNFVLLIKTQFINWFLFWSILQARRSASRRSIMFWGATVGSACWPHVPHHI